jgi:hypothetical protein
MAYPNHPSTQYAVGDDEVEMHAEVDQTAEPLHERHRAGQRDVDTARTRDATLPRADRAHASCPEGVARRRRRDRRIDERHCHISAARTFKRRFWRADFSPPRIAERERTAERCKHALVCRARHERTLGGQNPTTRPGLRWVTSWRECHWLVCETERGELRPRKRGR